MLVRVFFYNNSNPPAPIDTYFNLEFISYNLAFGYAILPDLYIEPSANLAVKSFPTNKVDNILIWNLSLKYQGPLIGASR